MTQQDEFRIQCQRMPDDQLLALYRQQTEMGWDDFIPRQGSLAEAARLMASAARVEIEKRGLRQPGEGT